MSSAQNSKQPPKNMGDVLQSISDHYPTLTPQLKKAADYVLDNSVSVALLPIRSISDEAGVTPSTMMRLAKTLGFERFNCFKDVFKDSIHTKKPVHYGSRAQSLQELSLSNPSNKVYQDFANAAFDNLQSLFSDEVFKKLHAAADIILQGETVYVLGLRDSFASAHHFAYVGHIAFPNIRLIRGSEGNLITELAQIRDQDVVVVFGAEPYSLETVNSIDVIKAQGAQIITITDDLRSPLASGADVVFTIQVETPHFFPSIISTIALSEALVGECVAQGGKATVESISNYQETLRRLGGYYSLKES